jgi:hypothetical protein
VLLFDGCGGTTAIANAKKTTTKKKITSPTFPTAFLPLLPHRHRYQTAEDRDSNTESKAYDYCLIVVYPEGDSEEGVRETLLQQLNVPREMLKKTVFVTAIVKPGELAWVEEAEQVGCGCCCWWWWYIVEN